MGFLPTEKPKPKSIMTLKEAKQLKQGDIIYAIPGKPIFNKNGLNADGTPMRFKITSIKTWKTRPDEIRVNVKRGQYEFYIFETEDLTNFSTTEAEKESIKIMLDL
jgi:hypothetical protein